MIDIAIFSPAAGGNVGHGYIYALKLGTYLKNNNRIILFTINEPGKILDFKNAGINVDVSSRFVPGLINKKRFLKYGFLSEIIYGIYRIYYNYELIREFYKKNRSADIFHLFEFEYTALIIFSLFNKKLINRSVLGIHIADFRWIKGRSIIVNLYKSILNKPVARLIKLSFTTTTHGKLLKDLLVKNLKVPTDKVTAIHYGCNTGKSNLTRNEALNEIGLKDENRIIALFFGVIRSDKGIIEVINNFKNISESVLLLIVGSEGDISKEKITSCIRSNNINNRVKTIIEYIDEKDIKYYFRASHFILIPHKGNHVAFSGPLSLAVEFGRPVIASDIGEIGNFVRQNKIGNVFEHDNWNDFVRITNKFIDHTKSYDDDFFLPIQQKYSWENMAKKINKIYDTFK